ncbi:hypothetical protein LTR08_005969 [Meristemomyces frigidus]|nr:hypothetical protein LTR08_005969 [Meristemomyces frigidus]
MSLHSLIKPDSWLILRVPSVPLKCIEIKPNTIIDVGKQGSFPSNLLLGRPYYYTYEILEKRAGEAYSRLRIVPPSELNAEIVAEDEATSGGESRGEPATPGSNDVYGESGTAMKTNRLTVDAPSRQALTQTDIEELKKTAAGQDIIDKILANHAALDEKTQFSKAKYLVRKRAKYLRRFTVLPMEVGGLMEHIGEKEPGRILEMREETLGLVGAWSNAHVVEEEMEKRENSAEQKPITGGRWLVVDETGGLVVAALAERMGLLQMPGNEDEAETAHKTRHPTNGDVTHPDADGDVHMESVPAAQANGHTPPPPSDPNPIIHTDFPLPATSNAITLLHPAVQPNISLLKHFAYDANLPSPDHPLHTHLKTLSWLQLLHPEDDPTYREPPLVAEQELSKWKSGKRGAYFKKRRRWERCRAIVDETRGGGFEGLVIASNMDPTSILPHTISLIRGGGHVVIYSPTPEPLVKVMDLYSKERRTAFTEFQASHPTDTPIDADDFPVDPLLLLAPTLQSSRARAWQCLPGRTHPMMTSKGGPEGYVFTARRVMPIQGGVEARGKYAGGKLKRRKKDAAVAGAVAAGEVGGDVGVSVEVGV